LRKNQALFVTDKRSQKNWTRYAFALSRLFLGVIFVYASYDKIIHPVPFIPDSRKTLKGNHNLKRFLPFGLLVAFLILAFFNVLQAQEIRVPKLFLTDDMFDFKDVIEGETITHSFKIQNKGTDTLRILRVNPG